MSGEKTMSNDGTGLRDAELDARTIYDIACIRADASKATREDVEFKAIALRNYKAITALSAVAPPPALGIKWPSEAKRVGADWEARTTLTHHSMSEAQANVWNACRAACIASARSAAPAAPAQPEGGEAVAKLQAFKDYVHQRLDDMGVPADPESPHKAAGCRVGGRLDYVEARITRPAPARQAVTDEAWRDDVLSLLNDLLIDKTVRLRFSRESIERIQRIKDAALASNAAASAADAQEGE